VYQAWWASTTLLSAGWYLLSLSLASSAVSPYLLRLFRRFPSPFIPPSIHLRMSGGRALSFSRSLWPTLSTLSTTRW